MERNRHHAELALGCLPHFVPLSLDAWNDTTHPVQAATLPELFEQQVIRTPENTAVVFQDIVVSYAQLNTKANQLARLLIEGGVGPEHFVALALPRCADMVVALLAVLETGAAYLPIDPDYPSARVRFMLDDARAVCLLTTMATELAGAPVVCPFTGPVELGRCAGFGSREACRRVGLIFGL